MCCVHSLVQLMLNALNPPAFIFTGSRMYLEILIMKCIFDEIRKSACDVDVKWVEPAIFTWWWWSRFGSSYWDWGTLEIESDKSCSVRSWRSEWIDEVIRVLRRMDLQFSIRFGIVLDWVQEMWYLLIKNTLKTLLGALVQTLWWQFHFHCVASDRWDYLERTCAQVHQHFNWAKE